MPLWSDGNRQLTLGLAGPKFLRALALAAVTTGVHTMLFGSVFANARRRVVLCEIRRGGPGFTLIELLIVVAIIAILAAIAVPNFLEAQTRAKVSRSLADMRSLATALEAYSVDHNHYPPRPIVPVDPAMIATTPPPLGRTPTTLDDSRPRSWSFITTPVAYITSIPQDVFASMLEAPFNTLEYWDPAFNRSFFSSTVHHGGFLLYSVGPDTGDGWGIGGPLWGYPQDGVPGTARVVYDATNGTISPGNIFRFSHNSSPPGYLPMPVGLPGGL